MQHYCPLTVPAKRVGSLSRPPGCGSLFGAILGAIIIRKGLRAHSAAIIKGSRDYRGIRLQITPTHELGLRVSGLRHQASNRFVEGARKGGVRFNVGALIIIRIGFRGPLFYSSSTEAPKLVLAII